MDIGQIKERFGIVGRDAALERAIEVACKVAKADVSVLVTGESGVGKEAIPQIIHTFSPRKHEKYMAVNCGAIPEGTIDSELFGHEKGSFTGATDSRKGYFEEADGGTLFLDEVAELPLATQVRLLRVLQSGEFIKVGSSKIQKTNVRVIAATNVNLQRAISLGKFREDLYFRLCTVNIAIPSLRERKGDIHLLFRKFAGDFAEKYVMPPVRLEPEAVQILEAYRWSGNIRQLKSVTEQISILEENRMISADTLRKYLPDEKEGLPILASDGIPNADYRADRDLIFKILFNLRQEVDELKGRINAAPVQIPSPQTQQIIINPEDVKSFIKQEEEMIREEEEDLKPRSLQQSYSELIRDALERSAGNRKKAAAQLGISERTLYRKIKELGLQ